MRMGSSKELRKENEKPAAGIKSLMNVFRPFRDWLNTRANGNVTNGTNNEITNETNHEMRNGSVRASVMIDHGVSAPREVAHFSRNAHSRMSLPIMQQNKMRRQAYDQLQRRGQQVARSLGFIYLQHKGETKQAGLPNELTTIDTIRALFVCAFPHMLTMEFMSQPNIKIYIYSPSCNIFYELCDIEEVRHESVLRIHYSDPILPIAMPSQVPLANIGGPLSGYHPHHYGTMQRLPPRPMPPLQQHPGSRSSLGQPMQPVHTIQQLSPTIHQLMNSPTMAPQLSQVPPPKPRRMIPASYTMHRLHPAQQ